jgi:hypothetical protein
MKLIVETTFDDLQVIEESDAKGIKSLYIHGPFMEAEQPNRNGRIYPMPILKPEVTRYVNEYVNKNRALGELSHPQSPTVDPAKASHIITELKQDGNNFIGKAKITSTPNGEIVKGLMSDGWIPGVSSRGIGSLVKKNGLNEVQKDYRLSTVDIVADPSAKSAFVDGIMEGKEWIWDNGVVKEAVIAQYQKQMLRESRQNLEEKKLQLLNNFVQRL